MHRQKGFPSQKVLETYSDNEHHVIHSWYRILHLMILLPYLNFFNVGHITGPNSLKKISFETKWCWVEYRCHEVTVYLKN